MQNVQYESSGKLLLLLLKTPFIATIASKAVTQQQDGLSLSDSLEAREIFDKLSTFPSEGNSFDDIRIAAVATLVTKPEVFGDLIAINSIFLLENGKEGISFQNHS